MFEASRRGICILGLAAVAFAPAAAHAESDVELERAKLLFEDGRRLAAEGKYELACSKFEESLSLARGIGTRYNLADCEEHIGHLPRAEQLFLDVAEQAREAGQADRERVARDRAAAIDQKLSHLKFESAVPTLELALDGRKLDEKTLREPLAVEPGKHHVVASAEGKQSWASDIDVPKAGLFVIVAVPALENARPDASASAEAGAEPSESVRRPLRERPPAPEPPPDPHRGDGACRAALVIGGIGAGALIAGGVFGLQYLSSNHDAKGVCPSGIGCTQDDVDQHAKFVDDARHARTFSYIGVGVGAAALAGAAALYFTSNGHEVLRASTGFSRDGSWSATLEGRF